MTSRGCAAQSDFIDVRGLRYHVRRYEARTRPADIAGRSPGASAVPGPEPLKLFLFHGWLDVAATFDPLIQILIEETGGRLEVLAPDWRGFGHTEWPQDGYWFHDYVADIEVLIDHYSPLSPVLVVGHSMGGQATSLYAGLRPRRVHKLVLLDSLFLPDMAAEKAPTRFRKWLDQLRDLPEQKFYPTFEALAERVRHSHPRLSAERALFVARCWGREDGHGRISLCADPKHRLNGPGVYRAAESEAVWREVLAPTLFIDSAESEVSRGISAEEVAKRRDCFRDRRQVSIAGAGHMLHFDAPKATARAIAEFVS